MAQDVKARLAAAKKKLLITAAMIRDDGEPELEMTAQILAECVIDSLLNTITTINTGSRAEACFSDFILILMQQGRFTDQPLRECDLAALAANSLEAGMMRVIDRAIQAYREDGVGLVEMEREERGDRLRAWIDGLEQRMQAMESYLIRSPLLVPLGGAASSSRASGPVPTSEQRMPREPDPVIVPETAADGTPVRTVPMIYRGELQRKAAWAQERGHIDG